MRPSFKFPLLSLCEGKGAVLKMSNNGRHYAGKHSKPRKKSNKGIKIILIIAAIIFLVALIFVGLNFFGVFSEKPENQGEVNSTIESTSSEKTPVAENAEIVLPEKEVAAIELDNGITLEKLGSYTGVYVEDGSDAVVGGTAMIVVKNTGSDYIQYAEITVKSGNVEGKFNFSTLFPGETVVILEQNRKEYKAFGDDYTAEVANVVLFNEAPSLCEGIIKIQPLNGAINVTNVSGADIDGDVIIYYKNYADDMFYGGITYRVRITGGIKDGEIKQIVSDHFTSGGSKIVFVTCG